MKYIYFASIYSLWELLFFGCQASPKYEEPEIPYQITLLDRNKDGIADKKIFHAPGWADVDYELIDTNFNGRYDKKVRYCYTVTTESIDIQAEPYSK